jgi:PAS domain S-box-containing protein
LRRFAPLLGLLLAAAGLIGGALAFWIQGKRQEALDQWRSRLSAVIDHDRENVEQWVAAGTAIVRLAASFPAVEAVARGQGSARQAHATGHADEVLTDLASHLGLAGAWLLDAEGHPLVASAGAPDPADELADWAAPVVVGEEPRAWFARTVHGTALALFAARVSDDPPAVMVVTIDPGRHLYPLLRSETVATRTGETLLVQDQGGQALFLSPLRHQPHRHLARRHPMIQTLAAHRALRGPDGFGAFTDYRAQRVLAATRRVRNTDWALVAKVDEDEAFESFREELAAGLVVALALLGSACVLGYALWKRVSVSARAERRLRGEAERALRESEERYRRLAENAPDILFRFRPGPEARMEYISPAVTRLKGYTPEEHYADPELSFRTVHPDDLPKLRAIASGETLEGTSELRWIRKDGTLLWTEERRTAVRDDAGRVVAVEGITRDITDRKRVEESLKTISRAVEQAPVSVVITDTEGVIEYVNPKFTQVTGYTREQALGRKPSLLKSGLTPPETYAQLWLTILSGREWQGELVNRRRDGQLFTEWASISPVLDPSGRVTHFVAVKEDVTASRKADEALRETQRQLLQSQKIEAIGRLAGGVAHDFNNLLAVIMGYAEMLGRMLGPGHAGKPKLDQILRASARAAGVTQQLLAFSRKQVMQPKLVDLNAVVGDVEKMLRRLIGEDVELVTRLAAELGTVRVDPGQIEQVIVNLAVNARDAMPQGGWLALETANFDLDHCYAMQGEAVPPGPYVMLAVSDNGCGMGEDTKAKIFEPFFTTKPREKGTGLGLATVYGIVKQSGGFIWVDSELGHGTTFKVYLPRLEEIAERPGQAAPRTSIQGGSETILLVEDQAEVREIAREALQSLGYSVLHAPGAEDALLVAEAHGASIDLLLTDVVMPRVSGRQLAKQLKARLPATRVLYMSGYTSDIIAAHGVLEAGVLLLEKPFTLETLAAKVREALAP